jgi:hypothetical protein
MARPRHSFEDSVVADDLRYWGYYKGRQYAADGSSPENTIANIMSGAGSIPGHKVLVVDMTPRAWQINARVFRLPTDYVSVLVGRYCLPVKHKDGQPYSAEEVAEVLKIGMRIYWGRLSSARSAYRRTIFAETVPLQFVRPILVV